MQTASERIPLRHAAAQRQLARLREPKGSDELALSGVDTRSAVQLLDRLWEAAPCSCGELSASDRDGLLCALHRALWGDRIVSTLECAACGAAYDLSFELGTLQRQLGLQADPARVDAPRHLTDERGCEWQLPDASDEESAAQLGPVEGRVRLRALVAAGDEDDDTVNQCLEALAPLVDVDLDTVCPECAHAQLARFDIQSFTLQRLLDEREGLMSEVHALASGYGWPLHDIVSLPRSLRRSLVQRLTAAPAAWG